MTEFEAEWEPLVELRSEACAELLVEVFDDVSLAWAGELVWVGVMAVFLPEVGL